MPISHKHKTIFIHIPKTAGTSIERSLGIGEKNKDSFRHHDEHVVDKIKYALQHYTSKMLINNTLIKPYWKSYYKFTIVRHPYTRVLSEYFWKKGKKTQGLEFDHQDFKDHLKSYYEKIDTDHKLSQTEYVYSSDGKILIDEIFKFEEITKSFKIISNKLNLKSDLKQFNKSSNSAKYTEFLDKDDKNLIYKLYKNDFKNFRYAK